MHFASDQNLTLPAIAAPMFLISGPEMVIAASKAGIIGAFPTPNARTSEILDDWMAQITTTLAAEPNAAPWAANLVVHRSNPRLAEDVACVVKYKPPLVITALGSPAEIIEQVHSYGGLVYADVNSVAFARKAAAAGVDGLVLVGAGAGGHTGQIAGFAFVEEVRKFWDGAIVLGGAISSGHAIRAAEVLGADLAYLGTSLIPCEESLAVQEYKQMVLDAGAEDIIPSNAITGVTANWLKQSLINAGHDPDNMGGPGKINFADPQNDRKAWKHVWAAGQGVGAVTQNAPIADIISRMGAEYDDAIKLPAFGRNAGDDNDQR
ncbi:NAD(P)H-dependent flavin oxidoreductase [Parasphingorhabdus sp.]|uniref:NAD(P)H-dependent flavin oxidoreductase n=1 Tax=Parasphingorhabdus sp. TaxID=2709688 RepID=UPI003A924F94